MEFPRREYRRRRGPIFAHFPAPKRLTFGDLEKKNEESKGNKKGIIQDENWKNVILPKMKVF